MKIRPGMVTRSEIRKNQFRLAMMSNTRAGLSPDPAADLAGARDELLGADAVEPGPSRPRLNDDRAEDRAGDDDGAEHRDEHAEDQDEGEPPDRRRAEQVEDRGGDQARHVRVEDRVPGPTEAGLDGGRQRLADPHLLLHPFEDQDVRVDGHADREDEASNARERQGHRDQPEQGEYDEAVVNEREARDDAWQPVVDEHKEHHEEDADDPRQQTLVEELLTERRADRLVGELPDGERQRSELEDGDELRRLLERVAADRAVLADLDVAAG